jgi:hypothetical protein
MLDDRMAGVSCRGQTHDHEAGERRGFEIAATLRLHVPQHVERRRPNAVADQSQHGIGRWREVMSYLANGDERRKRVADHGKPRMVEPPMWQGSELERKLRHVPPRRRAVVSQLSGERERGQDWDRERLVFSVSLENGLAQDVPLEALSGQRDAAACRLVQPRLGAREVPIRKSRRLTRPERPTGRGHGQRRPHQRRRADVAATAHGVAPAAICVLMGQQPAGAVSKEAIEATGIVAAGEDECDDRGRGGERAARKRTFPVTGWLSSCRGLHGKCASFRRINDLTLLAWARERNDGDGDARANASDLICARKPGPRSFRRMCALTYLGGFTMRKLTIGAASGAALVVVLAVTLLGRETQDKRSEWAMNATIIEACSCPMFCQCYFNTKPSEHSGTGEHAGHGQGHFCRFNNAFKVNTGHRGSVRLDEAKFWVAGDLGDDFSDGEMGWAVLHFDSAVSKPQRDAIVTVLKHLYPVKWQSFTIGEDAPMTWSHTRDQAEARLGDGRLAEVVLKRAEGMRPEPVIIQNLKYWGAPRNDGFVLMPNEVEAYRAGDKAFEFKGTNGFMITFDIDADTAPPAATGM